MDVAGVEMTLRLLLVAWVSRWVMQPFIQRLGRRGEGSRYCALVFDWMTRCLGTVQVLLSHRWLASASIWNCVRMERTVNAECHLSGRLASRNRA